MKKLELHDIGQTKVVSFPHISVPHGCSTRIGGVSVGHLESLNTGFTVGDDAASVWENRSRFGALLGAKNLPWLLSMTHGTEVIRVDQKATLPEDFSSRPGTFYSADAAVTNVKGVPLSLTVADCVPVFFYDEGSQSVGVAHAGWRGTVGGIVSRTIEKMQSEFGANPAQIRVGIGPSIGPQAFEVGAEVLAEFSAVFSEPGVVLEHPDSVARQAGKGFVNLWEANRRMALRAGATEENIQISGWCTHSNPTEFFSHRRDAGKTGRLLAGIVLS